MSLESTELCCRAMRRSLVGSIISTLIPSSSRQRWSGMAGVIGHKYVASFRLFHTKVNRRLFQSGVCPIQDVYCAR